MHSPLEVAGIGKSYDGKNSVLNNATFTLKEGEIFGLIGLNGAGKTTLIKIVLDLIGADAGEAKLFGLSSKNPEARRHLSYLPEKFQPSRYLKGYEYLGLALSYYGKKADRAEARDMAAKLDLNPGVLSAKVGTYSKGMGQKLGLAGAFLVDAPLLILDEPMSGLDPRARIRLKETLLAARAQGKTIFFSSHILSDIDEICDRIGVIHDGTQRFTGTPAEFKAAYGQGGLEKAFLKLIEAKPEAIEKFLHSLRA
jgi:ABC-2 type transport system ATP-binding protein